MYSHINSTVICGLWSFRLRFRLRFCCISAKFVCLCSLYSYILFKSDYVTTRLSSWSGARVLRLMFAPTANTNRSLQKAISDVVCTASPHTTHSPIGRLSCSLRVLAYLPVSSTAPCTPGKVNLSILASLCSLYLTLLM